MIISDMPQRRRPADQAATPATICAVSLIDRRTGSTHRVNGTPIVRITRNPVHAVGELLGGRDVAVWDVRIEPIAVAVS
jgi:hypothetical protein